jgi:hypothetical protein
LRLEPRNKCSNYQKGFVPVVDPQSVKRRQVVLAVARQKIDKGNFHNRMGEVRCRLRQALAKSHLAKLIICRIMKQISDRSRKNQLNLVGRSGKWRDKVTLVCM